PVLANMTLDGMERMLKEAFPRRAKLNFIRYADDFVITAASKELLEARVKPMVASYLSERGLTLSDEKTLVTNVDDGFDFLGFRVQSFKGFLYVGPSKKNTKALYAKVSDTLRRLRAAKQGQVIGHLN